MANQSVIAGFSEAVRRQRMVALPHAQIVKAFTGLAPDPYIALRAICTEHGFHWMPSLGDPSVTLVQLLPKDEPGLRRFLEDQIAYSGSASIACDIPQSALQCKPWQAQRWIEVFALNAGLDWSRDFVGNRWILRPIRT